MVAGVDNAGSPLLAATPPAPPPPVRQQRERERERERERDEDQKGSEHARMGTRWQEETEKGRGDGARLMDE